MLKFMTWWGLTPLKIDVNLLDFQKTLQKVSIEFEKDITHRGRGKINKLVICVRDKDINFRPEKLVKHP